MYTYIFILLSDCYQTLVLLYVRTVVTVTRLIFFKMQLVQLTFFSLIVVLAQILLSMRTPDAQPVHSQPCRKRSAFFGFGSFSLLLRFPYSPCCVARPGSKETVLPVVDSATLRLQSKRKNYHFQNFGILKSIQVLSNSKILIGPEFFFQNKTT